MATGTTIFQWLPMGVALLAGAAVPLQGASNAALGRALGHPLWATMVSLVVSMLVVLPLMGSMLVQAPRLVLALSGPWWLWLGGIVGVVYLTTALVLLPRLGATSFIVCVIAGQMLASLLLDHFGLMGLPVKPVGLARMAGVALILVGIWLQQSLAASPTTSVPTTAGHSQTSLAP